MRLRLLGSLQFFLVSPYRKTKSYLDYRDFFGENSITTVSSAWKITVIEVDECSVVTLKFTIPGFLDVFGRDGHSNQGPAVIIEMKCPRLG